MWKSKVFGEKICRVPIRSIVSSPWKIATGNAEETERLAATMSRYGMSEPLVVRRIGKEFELLFGEKRLAAARLLRWEKADCLIKTVSSRTAAEMILSDVWHRSESDLFKTAELVERIFSTYRQSPSSLAERVGVSESAIQLRLQLLRFSGEERELFRELKLCERDATALLRLSDPSARLKAMLSYRTAQAAGISGKESKEEAEAEESKPFSDKTCLKILPTHKGSVKDVRILTNSVDRAIDGIRRSGVDLEAEKNEEKDAVFYSIRIPKLAP